MTKSLTYVEIDVPYCSLTYGTSPCSAVLGASGADRCYNTINTCQALTAYAATTITLRFAIDAAYLPSSIPAIPSLVGVQYDPATISLGENLGLRATLTLKFKDHPHSDTGLGLDQYATLRSYNPFKQGTFWGKFRARQPYVWGMPIRLIRGDTTQALANMETRHFLGDSFDGPGPDGIYTLVAKDALRFATGDVSQAPVVSQGYLSANIISSDTSCTLLPAGIGDSEYATSGYVCIGGNEICSFTRSAGSDTLTLTRAQLGTTASAHSQEDAVQTVLYYNAQDPANIIADLLQTYAAVPANYIPLTDWLSETGTYLNQVYTGIIPKPTSVETLINELIQQAALALWWDDLNQVIKLQVLRGIPTDTATFDETNILAGTFNVTEQQDKRITECWVNYGERDPTLELTQLANYRSVAATIDLTTESNVGTPIIETIYSRWIAEFGRTIAQQLGAVRIARYKNPPRKFNFELFRGSGQNSVILGGGYKLKFWNLQDAAGAAATVPIQITRLEPEADRLKIEAWEVTSSATTGAAGSGDHTITIDVTSENLNLRTIHDALYTPAVSGTNVRCTINSGVIVGSTSTGAPAFDVGDWATGVNVFLTVNGRIQGAGGNGGAGAAKNPPPNGGDGQNGGTALYTRYAINLTGAAGAIWGGGGGGGGGGGSSSGAGGGGGGGAGYINPGNGGNGGGGGGFDGKQGTATAGGKGGASGGGTGGAGGDGGGPGQQASAAGGAANKGARGSGGAAIDGWSFVTLADSGGDIRGSEIN